MGTCTFSLKQHCVEDKDIELEKLSPPAWALKTTGSLETRGSPKAKLGVSKGHKCPPDWCPIQNIPFPF